MAKFDLNDRQFSTEEERTPFFPRCDARYRLKLVGFDDFDSEQRVGWTFDFVVTHAEAGKQDALFEPLPKVGDVHRRMLCRVTPAKGMAQKEMGEMRRLLAALSGVEHSAEFDANKALAALTKAAEADALDSLDGIECRCEGYRSKPKDDGTIYINTSFRYSVAAE